MTRADVSLGCALLVGIDAYHHFQALPEAVANDARDVAAALRVSGYSASAVTVLEGADATSSAIQREMARLAAEARFDETFILFFSGHGRRVGDRGELHLLPSDADPDDLAASALSASRVASMLSAICCRRQVVILDACHSGGMVNNASGVGDSGPISADLDMIAGGGGRVVISSSRANEISLILPGHDNSVFTTALLEALNAEGIAGPKYGVLEIFSYVARRVPEIANQHPIIKTDGLEGDFPFVRMGPRAEKTTMSFEAIGAEELLCELYPFGPTDAKLWSRAGGDQSRLEMDGTGAARWHVALRSIGYGGEPGLSSIVEVAYEDFPHHPGVRRLRKQLQANR